MPLATWKALCIDATDLIRLAGFWAAVLGRSPADGDGESIRLAGERDNDVIWLNAVPEPKSAKHRVHLDVEVGDLDGLRDLGAAVVRPPGDDRSWWVMADVEGGEFCAFVRDGRPSLPGRLYEVVVDCADPFQQAEWWGRVLGLDVEKGPRSASLDGRGTLPFDYLCLVPVPEPKAAKNRVHWDLDTADVASLVTAGARILRKPDDDIFWHIMADPEGNEFCAFTATT